MFAFGYINGIAVTLLLCCVTWSESQSFGLEGIAERGFLEWMGWVALGLTAPHG